MLRASSSSRGICCCSRTTRGRCSRQIRASIWLVGVIGIRGVTSGIRGVAEGIHVAVAAPMASLAAHVVARESIITDEAW